MPQPMSTPTALGQTYFSEAKTAPMATPAVGAGDPVAAMHHKVAQAQLSQFCLTLNRGD